MVSISLEDPILHEYSPSVFVGREDGDNHSFSASHRHHLTDDGVNHAWHHDIENQPLSAVSNVLLGSSNLPVHKCAAIDPCYLFQFFL